MLWAADVCSRATFAQPVLVSSISLDRFLRSDAMLSAVYATAIPSVCLSVCPSVTRVDQSKMVEVTIMQFSPYSSPIPLVLAR